MRGKVAERRRIISLCGHPAAEGHFPGNPIIPGAVVLREIVAAVRAGGQVAGTAIRSAKFHQPVRPGNTVVITWRGEAGGGVRFACSIEGSDRPAVTVAPCTFANREPPCRRAGARGGG